MKENKCQLNNPPFYQCCCVCESQRKVMGHTKFTGKYVCSIFFEMAKENEEKFIIENTKHCCGCEMWNDISKG